MESGIKGFAVLVFLLVLVVGPAMMFRGCLFSDTIQANAEHSAHTWIGEMFPEAQDVHIVCQGTDSDGNGYVTCSARIDNERLNIECYDYVAFDFGNTCRETTIIQGTGFRSR